MQVGSKSAALSMLLSIALLLLTACTPADENAIPYGDVVYTRVAPGIETWSSSYETFTSYPFAATRMDGVFVFRSPEDIAKKPMSNRAKRRDEFQPGSWQYQAFDISVDLHDKVVLPSDLVEFYDEGFFQKHDLMVVIFPTSEAFQHTLTGITREDGRVVVSIDEAAPEDRSEPIKHLGPYDQPSGEELWHDVLAVKLLPQSTYQYTITGLYYQDGRLTVCAATLERGGEFSSGTPPVLLLVDLDKDSVPAGAEIDLRLSTILLG